MNPLRRVVGTRFNIKLLSKYVHTTTIIHNSATETKASRSSTVDNQEVDHHSKIAENWWNPNGPMIALHNLNLLRVPFVRDGLVDVHIHDRTPLPLENTRILDVGCGGGILSEPLARLGAQVTGLDASQDLIDLAISHCEKNRHLQGNKPNYICSTIEQHIETYEGNYDAVVASEVLEHVNKPELFIEACVKATKPGGKLFFTTPNRTKVAKIGVIYLAEYVLTIVPKGTHQIDKFVTPPELTLMLERNNCHVEMTHGLLLNPFSNKWSWCESNVFCYALQAGKLTTLEENRS